MDNYSIFIKSKIAEAIEPYMPGASEHVMPISYHAWTPDIFLFLFRLTVNNEEKFFVIITFDYLSNGKDEAVSIVSKWCDAEINFFIDPATIESKDLNSDGSIDFDDTYRMYLAEVGLPKTIGYWTNNITVTKDDDLSKKLAAYPKVVTEEVQNLLVKNKNYTITVYKNSNDHYEYFYN